MTQPSERLAFAIDLARRAAELGLKHFRSLDTLTIEKQGASGPRLQCRPGSRDLHSRGTRENLPDDGIVGEEHAPVEGTSGHVWVIDPIDGTANFVAGIPAWCVVLACSFKGTTEIGVICEPSHGETFWAERGKGAFVNGKPIAVSQSPSLAQGSVATGFAARQDAGGIIRLITSLIAEGGMFFRNASGALMLAYVASGRLIGYIEEHMNSWDCIAGLLMIEEAGGKIMPFDPATVIEHGTKVVAGGPHVFPKLENLPASPMAGDRLAVKQQVTNVRNVMKTNPGVNFRIENGSSRFLKNIVGARKIVFARIDARRDDGRHGRPGRAQSVFRILEDQAFIRPVTEIGQHELVDFRVGFLALGILAGAHARNHHSASSPSVARIRPTTLERLVVVPIARSIRAARARRNRSSTPGLSVHRARHHQLVPVEFGLAPMQRGASMPFAPIRLRIGLDAFAAARHLPAIGHRARDPTLQASPPPRRPIEGDAMQFLGLGERAVDIEDQRATPCHAGSLSLSMACGTSTRVSMTMSAPSSSTGTVV
jgi:myo-inositol-1(or 4)-monophosphatase